MSEEEKMVNRIEGLIKAKLNMRGDVAFMSMGTPPIFKLNTADYKRCFFYANIKGMKEYYTDGSAIPNPGKGGFAVICEGRPVALGREVGSTNIRMEGQALIAAFELVQAGDKIWTDSEFWVNVLKKWAPGWAAKDWQKKGGEIKNLDLVKKLYGLFLEKPGVELNWTRGHVGTEGNELADEWANKAREDESLLERKFES